MWPVTIMYLLLIPSVTLFIHNKHMNRHGLAITLKAFCTGIILLTGIYGMLGTFGEIRVYAILIVAGLALGLIGDVSICFQFLMGMLFFGLGHLCYIASIMNVSTNAIYSIPIFIILCILILIFLKKSHLSFGKLFIPVIIYSLIIIGMISLATTMLISPYKGGFILFMGAALFTLSDFILAWNTFGKFDKRPDIILLGLYYIGQSLFAVSIFCLR